MYLHSFNDKGKGTVEPDKYIFGQVLIADRISDLLLS